MNNGTVTLTRRQRIAVKVVSGAFVVTAGLIGVALGSSVNGDPAHAESTSTCAVLCSMGSSSGAGAIGQTGALLLDGTGGGSGTIGAVPTP
jgi:hypothetical protein